MSKRTITSALVIPLLILITALAAPTASAAPVPAAPADAKNCFVVVHKLKPGQITSDIAVPPTCTSEKPSARPAKVAAAAPDGVVLATFFQYSGFNIDPTTFQDNGGLRYTVYGYEGPCDVLGYGFSNLTFINQAVLGISSYTTFNSCDTHQIYNQIKYGGVPRFFGGYSVPYVGPDYDNRVFSFKLYKGPI